MCKEHIQALKQTIKLNVRGGIPILRCLEHSDGTLKATNLTVMTQIKTPTIPDGIWNAEALEFGFRDDTKNTEFELVDFPEVELKNVEIEIELTPDDMANIFRASEFVSKDMTRPVLTGVAIIGGRVYGCDGYKLFRDDISNNIGDREIVIPMDTIKVLKSAKAEKHNWILTVYEGHVAFVSGNITIMSGTIDGRCPDYESLITSGAYDSWFEIDLKNTTIPKDWNIRANTEDGVVEIVDGDGKAIRVSELVKVEPTELKLDGRREIVMGLSGYEKKYTTIDPKLLRMFKKNTIRIYHNEKLNEVKIVK